MIEATGFFDEVQIIDIAKRQSNSPIIDAVKDTLDILDPLLQADVAKMSISITLSSYEKGDRSVKEVFRRMVPDSNLDGLTVGIFSVDLSDESHVLRLAEVYYGLVDLIDNPDITHLTPSLLDKLVK